MRRVVPIIGALLAAILAVGVTHTRAQPSSPTDTEPNDTCKTAQDLGTLSGPITMSGSVEGGPSYPGPYPTTPTPGPTKDTIDYYKIAAPAGTLLRIDLRGALSGQGTMTSPFLGIYDSYGCYVIAYVGSYTGYDPVAGLAVPPSGAIIVAVSSTAYDGSGGTYSLSIQEAQLIGGISGKLAGNTADPLQLGDTNVELQTCTAGECRAIFTTWAGYNNGEFNFVSEPNTPLFPGSYKLVVRSQRYEAQPYGPFEVGPGENKDVGTLTLTPQPTIGAIRGSLVDTFSGRPLTYASNANVTLFRCEGDYCYDSMINITPDAAGAFRFDASSSPYPLLPGNYRLNFSADQYQSGSYGPFTVGADQDLDLGAIRLQPNTVQLLDPKGCPEIPARGGICQYSVRVVNGRNATVKLRVWSTVQTYGTAFGHFQPGLPQSIRLGPGESKAVTFQVRVPRTLPAYSGFCAEVSAADADQDFYFQPLASAQPWQLCSYKGGDSVTRPLPEERAHEMVQGARPGRGGHR